jgi:hypothetical protein
VHILVCVVHCCWRASGCCNTAVAALSATVAVLQLAATSTFSSWIDEFVLCETVPGTGEVARIRLVCLYSQKNGKLEWLRSS